MSESARKSRECNRRVTKGLSPEKIISRSVIRLREEKKLTQIALAERAKLSRRTINEVESGRKNRTSISTLMQLAAALGVTPDELLGLRTAVKSGSPKGKKKAPPGDGANM